MQKISRILFIEPPKDYWFLMGEYLPPPTTLLTLAAYLEKEIEELEIEVMDCQAEHKNWKDVERYIELYSPHMVATSGFTCNTYACVRIADMAKKINPDIKTILGGQHFTATADETLKNYPEIDFIVRNEGEETLSDLIKTINSGKKPAHVMGISYRHNGKTIHNPDRPFIENLDTLPIPAYYLVQKNLKQYHFTMMAGKNKRYLILEGSRGCSHRCTFCTQWKHWHGRWRTKSAKRIADEMEHLYENYDGEFLWLTDDNFGYGERAKELYGELKKRRFVEDITWFFQARTDDIANNPDLVSKLRRVGHNWSLVGVENNSGAILKNFKKGLSKDTAKKAVKILNDNDIFTQSMFVIGSRTDTEDSIDDLARFSVELGTDLALYTVLTPFPGTEVHELAESNGWIEDKNYANYDMVHATMPTETLSVRQVQRKLFDCYKTFYGSITKSISGMFAKNKIKKRVYRHMAGKFVLTKLKGLI